MWKTVCGFSVYVENGYIIRAMKNQDTEPAYIYKKTGNSWSNVMPCKISTFKSGFYRGNYMIF